MYVNTLECYQIRTAHSDESTLIIHMLKEIAQWLKKKGINQWQYLLEGGDDEEIIQAIKNKNTYIVLKDNEMIATFTLSSIQSEWDRHIFGEEIISNSLYLHRLAVIPKYMKRGIGKNILIWIQEHMENDKEYLKLDCVTNNIKLNNFYKNNGFEYVGVTDGHSKFQKCMKN
ncbi:GNAT family N-acetyltransferase [Bacillus pseudomycoides]|uniref:GNAT family N-acetyltransferase n=1 Tax=Bacillus pseudomycoides TaxID=64104 RepID=UPI000BED1AC6|nr:GNAT family N-acetyltransferase [Bacillus pseudomycoides]PEE44839.1 GNAT family N-acetyltransferase [Bacillus pseudomycoides]PGA89439.1 GNAT family N-acetyltransferase [Bacillus pseudomycoides]PHF44845.1 GNAT family N-acetyltransferase [Bacillus pseudomycoides]